MAHILIRLDLLGPNFGTFNYNNPPKNDSNPVNLGKGHIIWDDTFILHSKGESNVVMQKALCY